MKTHEALRETLQRFNTVAAVHRALLTGEDPEQAAQMAAEAEGEIHPYIDALREALFDEMVAPGSTQAKGKE